MSEQRSDLPSSSEAQEPGPEPGTPSAAAGLSDDALVPPSPEAAEPAVELPRLQSGLKGRRLARPDPAATVPPFTPEQRLLLLDTWRRSGLPAGDFASLVGLSKHILYARKNRFDADGPAGLLDQPRGVPAGSRLPELTRRAILMLKESHPDWGCQRISNALVRGPALPTKLQELRPLLLTLPDDETVVFQDEVDGNLNPKLGCMWMAKGKQAEVVTPGDNAKRYLAGSLHWRTGKRIATRGPKRDGALFVAHLHALRQRLRRYRKVHVICDNAGFPSDSWAEREFVYRYSERVVLPFLPKYAPECNPSERVWWVLHEQMTRNHRCQDLEELVTLVFDWLGERKYFDGDLPSAGAQCAGVPDRLLRSVSPRPEASYAASRE